LPNANEDNTLRILITGATGFVGKRLIQHLLETQPSFEIHGATRQFVESININDVQFHFLDLKEFEPVLDLVASAKPDIIYHLAARSFVPESFDNPWETLETNIRSQLNLIQACLSLKIKPKTLVITSADIYGPVNPNMLPITEDMPLLPTSPYSVSKIAQDMLALQYHFSHDLPIMRARPFNHIGPGQKDNFVAPSFGTQIAKIEESGRPGVIKVGDLSAERDFTDVRDIVRAYRLIAEFGAPGEVYNIASGESHSIQSLLDTLLSFSSANIEIEIDPARLRPVTIPILRGDYSRLQAATGWEPHIPFEQSLSDILEECRQNIHQQGVGTHV
jgi:GDP-4-dehydro-6-deoxy-D-mannose reductase